MTHTNRTTTKWARLGGCPLALALIFMCFGCSSSESEPGEHLGCHDTCDEYATCFDLDYAVASCTMQCETALEENEDVGSDSIDECVFCISEGCYADPFPCEAECDGIIATD